MATWVFQGNPSRFKIDDYVACYPELLYWRTPRHATEIVVGDQAYLWRAGPKSGVIAFGTIVEAPTPGSMVKHPEALGSNLWHADEPEIDEQRTGIHLQEVRLTDEDAYLHRSIVRDDPVLGKAAIIKMPNGTVYRLTENEVLAMERLWGTAGRVVTTNPPVAFSEGNLRLAAHFRRERSTLLRDKKLKEVHDTYGKYVCELCGLTEDSKYPSAFGARVFEVHHLIPLSKVKKPVCTTLADLALLCANCHRAVHASSAVDDNYDLLRKHLR
jgi:hypothetical protein